MMRLGFSTAILALLAGPAVACDITRTVLDTHLAPEAERNAAIAACIADGGDVNANPDGFSTLTLVVSHHNVFGVKAFLDAGADPNALDADTLTPIAMAATLRDPMIRTDILRLLVDAGADLNVEDSTEFTPLSYAIITQEPASFIVELLDLGANPSFVNRQSESALMSTVLGQCNADAGFALMDAGGRLDDMPALQARSAAEHATRNCTQSDHDRTFLAQLLETAQ